MAAKLFRQVHSIHVAAHCLSQANARQTEGWVRSKCAVRGKASRVSLTSLTICKDANIIAIQGRCDQLGHILEDACLLNLRPKDSVKVKGLQAQATSTLSLGHQPALTSS